MSFLTSAADQILGDLNAPYALIESAFRSVGGIIFDVTVREIHTDEAVVTQFPVETGTPISDHTYFMPAVIEIVAASSDASNGPGYVQALYQQLLALRATREPFNVYTGKRAYQNMLFGNITVVTDETSEYALMVTTRLQEVIITDTTDLSGSNMTAANQADPASTSPETQMGTQGLQSYSGLSGFSASGAVASTGTTVGPGVSSAQTFGNAGGGLSFDSYMSGF